MNRESLAKPLRDTPYSDLGRAVVVLAVAVAVTVLAAQLLLAPPAHDLRALGLYVLVSGAASIALGAAVFHWSSRSLGLRLRSMMALGAIVGSAAGLLNVLVVARLMFVSTAHDLQLLAALVLCSGVISAGFSLWVAARLAGRLTTITAAIRTLATGRYEQRLQVAARDELSLLATDVNELARRLEAAESERAALEVERRELTAAVSHDLRTPLASLRAMIEALGDGMVESPAETARYYRSMGGDVERLSRLVDDLFELAQFDAGAVKLDRRPVALDEIAREVVESVDAQARAAGVHLWLESPEPVPAEVDGFLLERAVRNLVVNALEHTPAAGRVGVRVVGDRHTASVIVEDTGEGIAPDDLPRIWDRFFRGERSRSRNNAGSNGVGLGLAIVRGIVTAHDGSVSAESVLGTGARLRITLPRVARAR